MIGRPWSWYFLEAVRLALTAGFVWIIAHVTGVIG